MATPYFCINLPLPLQVYPPFLAKNFVPSQVTQFSGGPTHPLIRGGGSTTMMNPNDVMGIVLKDIILCLLGFRFIYIVYISWYYMQDVSNVLLPPTCLSFGLPVCQSNFSGWFRSQGKCRVTLEFKSSGCAVSNNLMTQVSVCQSQSKLSQNHLTRLNSTKCYCFKLIY